jgi:hypothetical protein
VFFPYNQYGLTRLTITQERKDVKKSIIIEPVPKLIDCALNAHGFGTASIGIFLDNNRPNFEFLISPRRDANQHGQNMRIQVKKPASVREIPSKDGLWLNYIESVYNVDTLQ